MKHFELGDCSSTEPHLGAEFDRFLSEFCHNESDKSVESRLRRWVELQRYITDDVSLPERFHDALRELINKSGKSNGAIAKAIGLTSTQLGRWINGDHRPSNLDKIYSLEEELGVHQGVLASRLPRFLLKHKPYKSIPKDWWPEEWSPKKHRAAYRYFYRMVLDRIPRHYLKGKEEDLRQAFDGAVEYVKSHQYKTDYAREFTKQRSQKYRFNRRDWPEHLKVEWRALQKYKTEPDSFFNEDRNGTWASATVEMALKMLESFYGYLRLPPDPTAQEGQGRGLGEEELTIAWLALPDVVKGYLDFQGARSGKYSHNVDTFISKWAALLREKSGWLWQNPQIGLRLPQEQWKIIQLRGGWQTHCVKAHSELKNSLKLMKKRGQIEYSRDPFAPILPILDHPEPIKPVLESLRYYCDEITTSERPNELPSASLATKWRNYLLLSLLIRLPLRAKHWTLMTYRKDNTGSLRQNPEGRWELILPFNEFKNHRNRKIFTPLSRDKILCVSFEEEPLKSLVPVLEFYLENYRPLIINEGDALFPSYNGHTLNTSSLAQIVRNWTREYLSEQSLRGCKIEGVHPFSTHAFRDIVATHVIKTTDSLEMAANILLDSQEIVAKHYARFLPSDRLGRVFQTLTIFQEES